MPKFSAEKTGPVQSNFGFSAIPLDDLKASEYTLVSIVTDCSGSVSFFAQEEEKALKEVISTCRRSPRADNLMVRYTRFNETVQEVHGFKLLQDCNPSDYDGSIQASGCTALYDATIDGVDALSRYGRDLQNNDYTANAILFVITDGGNNAGKNLSGVSVKPAFQQAIAKENLESIVTILIGVNVQDPTLSRELQTFSKDGGFTHYVELKDATEKSLAKLVSFVSKSISAQSMSLGTGGPSQQIPTI